ncbi:Rpn family recombination-promoting nuclease/putative transposase [Desulfobotulus mexicanus]|uniref:Rpn family recombination-promoting nuclease/putative transposase n=1 Tax=Desulfobotulus mexicanus TaxID=2586642 RepID=A0A5Q4VDA6_9BACT|nr:Rpn family recombination-promoting nuclease/putative transposase [Desulfobotulus mexicanus]TYT74953.1 Rpn family recombination-promoting nuclease/putative transposase [Desulfobotulus mexicanus]
MPPFREPLSGRSSPFSDLLYICQFKGKLIRIALLFEHKSYVDHDMLFKILLYMASQWERCRKQEIEKNPIISIVIYHGERKWQPGLLSDCFKDLPSMIKPFIPDSEYIFKATDLQPEYVAETIGRVSLKGKELAMTTAERLMNEGMVLGRNEGRYEGRCYPCDSRCAGFCGRIWTGPCG